MRFGSMNGHSESEVESIFMGTCWGSTQNTSQVDQFLLESHKILLDHDLDSLNSDSEHKNTLDVLDNLLINTNSINSALADLKPLPPFTNYTANLSINGIAGHHYHAIAQRLPDESNNNYLPSAYHQVNSTTTTQSTVSGTTTIQFSTVASPCPTSTNNTTQHLDNNNNHNHHSTNDHNLVSSSTCLAESSLICENDVCLSDGKIFTESQLRKGNKLFNDNARVLTSVNTHSVNANSTNANNDLIHDHNCNNGASTDSVNTDSTGVRIYTDCVDMTNIDELAAIISSAIADTTVNNQLEKEDGTDTRDSWMDIDAWIDSSIQSETSSTKLVVAHQDGLCDFILPNSPVHSSNTTLQNLLTHGYMPLLQNRLQNGPPSLNSNGGKSGEVHSSTSFDMPISGSSTSVSPPGSVVSTTADNIGINATFLTNNHNHVQVQQQNPQIQQAYHVTISSGPSSIKSSSDGICSPDRLANYPHTTTNTITPTSTSKTKRSRTQKKNIQQQTNRPQLNTITPSSLHFSSNELSGLLGKEKPVHRCTICNRGFLNKSNIKVHLRTHTGEKPFRCDVCAKAFRQKAHLLKHQQIHKRIGRD